MLRTCCLPIPGPANVRELDNLLQRALILVNGPVINPEHIRFEAVTETAPTRPSDPLADSGLNRSLRQTERDLILEALRGGAASRAEGRGSPGHQPTHPALQTRAPARGRHRRAGSLR